MALEKYIVLEEVRFTANISGCGDLGWMTVTMMILMTMLRNKSFVQIKNIVFGCYYSECLELLLPAGFFLHNLSH